MKALISILAVIALTSPVMAGFSGAHSSGAHFSGSHFSEGAHFSAAHEGHGGFSEHPMIGEEGHSADHSSVSRMPSEPFSKHAYSYRTITDEYSGRTSFMWWWYRYVWYTPHRLHEIENTPTCEENQHLNKYNICEVDRPEGKW